MFVRALLLALVSGVALAGDAWSQTVTYRCSRLLRDRLDRLELSSAAAIGGEPLRSTSRLAGFYEPRIYWPVWSEEGYPLEQVDSLIEVVRKAGEEGLSPGEFHLHAMQRLLDDARREDNRQSPSSLARLVDLELLSTDAVLTYGSQLLFGRTQPPEALKEGLMDFRARDYVVQAEKAVRTNRVAQFLDHCAPSHPGYRNLKHALARYRGILERGGWHQLKPGPALKRTDAGEQVRRLRERLDLECDSSHLFGSQPDTFDLDLEQAVKEFQRSHGLTPTGVVDRETYHALNIPVESRIRQLEVNLERWRWLPRTPPDRFIEVNIAGFSLRVVERDSTVMTMRTIVGKEYKPTPILASEITHLVLNPSWNVPRTIAWEEVIPLVRKDTSYLERRKFKIYSNAGRGTREVDPDSVDWTSADSMAYRFRQQPGPLNALGRMKFVFQNAYDVYIHDTNARGLFRRSVRHLSHGCIRIERPMALAEYVLRGQPGWNRKKLASVLETDTSLTLRLPQAIPVYFLYLTAWADGSGTLQFRNDIYSLDEARSRALAGRMPVMATLPEE